jgi:hypothetical protein
VLNDKFKISPFGESGFISTSQSSKNERGDINVIWN